MLFKQTFAEADKTPKDGWTNAKPFNTQATISTVLATSCGLNPKSVYDWANKFDVFLDGFSPKQLREISKVGTTAHDVFFIAVLNNRSLEAAQNMYDAA
jgi:hypothetical protein